MKREKFQNDLAALINYAKLRSIRILLYSYNRTKEEQRKLYQAGKSQLDGYKKRSKHQDWLAVDLVILDDSGRPVWDRTHEYEVLGDYWTNYLKGIWGGNWESLNDIYHFQYGG